MKPLHPHTAGCNGMRRLIRILIIFLPLILLAGTAVRAQISEKLAKALSSQKGVELPLAGKVGQNMQVMQNKQPAPSPGPLKSDPALRLLMRRSQTEDVIAAFRSPDISPVPYDITLKDGEWRVGVLMRVVAGTGASFLKSFDARNITEAGDILSADVPLSRIADLTVHPSVTFIETGGRRQPLNKEGRISINADKVHSGTGLPRAYQGEGVIMGVIDSGIDFTHPDFSDNTGSRIQYLLEYTGTNQLEWSRQQIVDEPLLVSQRDSDDGAGHGTHVTGTAAGGGVHDPQYTGIAPKSDIIFVKGFVNGSFSDNNVIGGAQYIFSKADQLGRPAVINMSLGSSFGPLDGSSLYEEALSSLTGPGRIIVAAAGNEGFDLIHAGGTLSPVTRYATFLLADNPDQTAVNMWHKPGAVSQVAVAAFTLDQNQELFFLGSTDFVASGSFMDYTPMVFEETTLGYVGVDAQTTADPRNGDGNILIEIVGDPDNNVKVNDYIWVVVYDSQSQGQFDMWSFGGEFWPEIVGISDDFPGIAEVPGNSNSTIGTPATAHNVIAVGSYATTNSWTNIDNQLNQWKNPDPSREPGMSVIPQIGQRSYFSSTGPTRDGRTSPDISAPGELVFSALSSHLTEGQGYQRAMVLQGGMYTASQGTSMASPHVAGVVALMLQINPDLTPAEVLEILQNTARADSFTGTLPNNMFGSGKIDAHAAVLQTLTTVSTPEPVATLRHFDPETEQRLIALDSFTPIDSGFVFGTNRYLDRAKASVFTLPAEQTEAELTRVNVWFGYRKPGLTTESYQISVYNGTASSGPTGAPIATKQFLLGEVNSDDSFTSGKEPTVHELDEPVQVPSSFFVSVEFGDYGNPGIGNAAIMATSPRGERVAEVWEQWSSGAWHNVSDAWFGQQGAPGDNGWHMWLEAELGTTVKLDDEVPELPSSMTLDQNYPNPFNPETRIRFTLPDAGEVSLAVYDLLGRQVSRLVSSRMDAGAHSITFNASGLSSGIYFYRLQSGGSVLTRKMMLMK